MKKAVIYCSISSDEQEENPSLQTQETACREYCKREGYQVDKVFIADGESGKITGRSPLTELLFHCVKEKDGISCIVVYSLSSLSRSLMLHLALCDFLDANKIALHPVNEDLYYSPSDRLMMDIFAAVAQYEHDLISE